MATKTAITQVPIHPLLANRWSGRAFDPNRPLEHETILALAEAARWTPSAFNDQPWRFIVWDRTANPADWQKALGCLGEKNQIWVKHAPVLWGVFANKLNQRGLDNWYGEYDTGAAAMGLVLQAEAMGLVAHEMAGFDKAKLVSAFAIPEAHKPMTIIALGYPGSASGLPEDLARRETETRQRLPLGEVVFQGRWDHPLE